MAIAVVSASKAFNLAGLKCAAVVTGSARMAAVVDRFPPDTRWRTGHLGVIASVAAFNDGSDRLNFGTGAEIIDEATRRMATALAG